MNEILRPSTLFDRPTTRQHPPHHLSSDRESKGFGRGAVMELVGKAPSFTPLSLLFQAARGLGRVSHWWGSAGIRRGLHTHPNISPHISHAGRAGKRKASASIHLPICLSLGCSVLMFLGAPAPPHTPRVVLPHWLQGLTCFLLSTAIPILEGGCPVRFSDASPATTTADYMHQVASNRSWWKPKGWWKMKADKSEANFLRNYGQKLCLRKRPQATFIFYIRSKDDLEWDLKVMFLFNKQTKKLKFIITYADDLILITDLVLIYNNVGLLMKNPTLHCGILSSYLFHAWIFLRLKSLSFY